MELVVNGKKMDANDVETVADLVSKLDVGSNAAGVAVAVNGAVVPRSRWSETALARGDAVEIIHAVQGG